MKFREQEIIYRAIFEGVVNGLRQAKEAGDRISGAQVPDLLTAQVFESLTRVVLFDTPWPDQDADPVSTEMTSEPSTTST